MIPALLIISAVVFLLSKIMPGRAGLLEEEPGDKMLYNNSSSHYQQEILIQYLEKTGQDLPVFYFSVATLAEPDTLYKIFPERERLFLKDMIFQYGNWEKIAVYYNKLLRLRRNIENATLDFALKRQLRRHLSLLFTYDEKNAATFKSLINELDHSQLKSEAIEAFQSYLSMLQHATYYKNLIPALHFHGNNNQYHQWLVGMLQGNLGVSYRDSKKVGIIIGEALSVTLLLTVASLIISWIVAIITGCLISMEQYSGWKKPVLSGLYVLDSIPLFLLAIGFLLLLTGKNSGLLPSYGLGRLGEEGPGLLAIINMVPYLVLPITCMTLVTLPYVTGHVHSALQEIKGFEYIMTARAKGLSERTIIFKHALRNALTPLITIISGSLPALISGALVVEVIFSIPGMGKLLADSVIARDYPVILGIVMLIALVKIISQIIADILYYLSDPRIKL